MCVLMPQRSERADWLRDWLVALPHFLWIWLATSSRHFSSVWNRKSGLMHFVRKFMTLSWCLWMAYWFLWDSLDSFFRMISGKRVTCIQNADAIRQKFLVHSSHDIQFRLIVPPIYHDIKIRVTAIHDKNLFNSCILCVLEYAFSDCVMKTQLT